MRSHQAGRQARGARRTQPDLSVSGTGREDSGNLQNADVIAGTASTEGRVLALDLGARRIGLALSDPLRLTAQGLDTLERRNKRQDLNFLKSLARRYGVSLVVVGNPVQMNGSEGSQSRHAREFAGQLERHLGIEVRLWDERLTSVEAHRVLRETGMEATRRRQAVDRLAAVLLLQSFLDSERRSRSIGGGSR